MPKPTPFADIISAVPLFRFYLLYVSISIFSVCASNVKSVYLTKLQTVLPYVEKSRISQLCTCMLFLYQYLFKILTVFNEVYGSELW